MVFRRHGIASIGSQAFSGCSALTNFFPLLPASLATLGSKAFDNGGSAMALATPLFLGTNGTPVTIAGDCTFRMCRIPSAVLGPGVTALPASFLQGDASLRRVAMHDGIVALGADGYQFYNTRITNAGLGRRVGSVPPYAFANNPALADVRLVSKSSIGNCAFENDKGLRNLYLGGPLPELHANAFKGWTAGQCLLHVQTNDETWEAWIRANVAPWDDLSEDLRDAFFDDWPKRRYALGRTVSAANPASQWVVYWSRFPPPTVLIVK